MQPKQKVPLGVAEAEALADWLQDAIADYFESQSALDRQNGDDPQWADDLAAEAREWAERVRPVPGR